MCGYVRMITTPEVWAVIRARHHDDMKVFSSFSAPDGDSMGNPDEGRMDTEYGFAGAPHPFIGTSTRWDIDREQPHKRLNERHNYWLCIPDGTDS